MDPTLTRLRLLVEHSLPGTMIPVESLRELLGLSAREDGGEPDEPPSAELTLDEVAEKVGRAPSTVRNWCAAGELPGAYRLKGREWRVPPAGLQAFLQQQAERQRDVPTLRPRKPNLGSWRRLRKAS